MFTRSSANAACGGLPPPSARAATKGQQPSSPAQHHARKSLPTNRTPFHVRGTRTFSTSVSYRDALTCNDANFLTQCHLASVSSSYHFSPPHGMDLFNGAGRGYLVVKMTHQ